MFSAGASDWQNILFEGIAELTQIVALTFVATDTTDWTLLWDLKTILTWQSEKLAMVFFRNCKARDFDLYRDQ